MLARGIEWFAFLKSIKIEATTYVYMKNKVARGTSYGRFVIAHLHIKSLISSKYLEIMLREIRSLNRTTHLGIILILDPQLLRMIYSAPYYFYFSSSQPLCSPIPQKVFQGKKIYHSCLLFHLCDKSYLWSFLTLGTHKLILWYIVQCKNQSFKACNLNILDA